MDYIRIGKHKLPTLLAVSAAEQERGLMYQEPPTPIMSFIYKEPRHNGYWMKNTIAPLDIVFCLKNKIVSIAEGIPHSTKIIGGNIVSDLVVEFPRGTCDKLGVQIGDEINLECAPQSLAKIIISHS